MMPPQGGGLLFRSAQQIRR